MHIYFISTIKRKGVAILKHSFIIIDCRNNKTHESSGWMPVTEVKCGLLFCRAHKQLSVKKLSLATRSLLTAKELQSCDMSVSMATKSSFLK